MEQDKREYTPIEKAIILHNEAVKRLKKLRELKDHHKEVLNESQRSDGVRIDFRSKIAISEFLPLHPEVIIKGYLTRLEKRIDELERSISRCYGTQTPKQL